MSETILVTGSAGFIGAFLCKRLLEETDYMVVGLDNCNDYYDPEIKLARLEMIRKVDARERFVFVKTDLANTEKVHEVFARFGPDIVVNLAAQAGVRYSIENPRAYIDSNLIGFFNILESCREFPVRHLIYASSSSVYGGNEKTPYSEKDNVDHPVSLYAATKKSDELMAYAYSKLYDIPTTALRFFTVYGPMGRPDMAYFSFTDKLVSGESIKVFNMGNCKRDFTYIDDVVEGIMRIIPSPPVPMMGDNCSLEVAHRIYNIGNSHPENLIEFVETLKKVLVEEGVLGEDFDLSSKIELVPMQPGDVAVTFADVSALEQDFGFCPSTKLEDGLRAFAKWYKEYYR